LKLQILVIPVLLFSISFPESLPGSEGHHDLFREVMKQYSRIRTIDSEIEQEIWNDENPPERFKGLYRADSTGRFRIDYSRPDAQIVLNNGKNLYWYYPNEKILYTIASLKNDAAPKLNPFAEYSKKLDDRFEIRSLGRGLHGFFQMAAVYQLIDREKGVAIVFWIDPEKHVVLKKTVSDRNGREYIKEMYGNFKKVSGIYYPSRVDVIVRTAAGIAGNTTYYRKVRLNKKFGKNLFVIEFPKDVKKRSLHEN